MRKILLGTTAVVGAALIAPVASAQEAPTVRIGGYIQAYFSNVIQSNPNTFNSPASAPATMAAASSGRPVMPETRFSSPLPEMKVSTQPRAPQ